MKDTIRMTLTISELGHTNEEVDDITRQLLAELKEMNILSAKLVSREGLPAGAKGIDAVTAGAIAMAVLPTMLPKVLEFLQLWTLQGKGRTIKFKGKIAGQQIEFEGSSADMEKLLALLEKKKTKQK